MNVHIMFKMNINIVQKIAQNNNSMKYKQKESIVFLIVQK